MRLKKVQVSPEMIVDILTPGHVFENCSIQEGLPAGAILRGVSSEPSAPVLGGLPAPITMVALIFEHESFPDIDDSRAAAPELRIVIARHKRGAA